MPHIPTQILSTQVCVGAHRLFCIYRALHRKRIVYLLRAGEGNAAEDTVRPRKPEVEAPRIRRRPSLAPPSTPPEPQGYDFGSPEANAAAKKLESMGAIVHPPGSSKVRNYSLLTGSVLFTMPFGPVKFWRQAW